MTNFLAIDDVVALHDSRVDARLIDEGKLDSALNRPRNIEAYGGADIHRMAAALCQGVCQAHAFLDGNKRTSLLAVAVFYALNGYDFNPSDADLLHLIVDLTTGDADAEKASSMFSIWAIPRPEEDPHERQ
ncbi:MAG: type II toxin-antitoxin system death-on-curing family toxin [Acidimicrobiales bacterium]